MNKCMQASGSTGLGAVLLFMLVLVSLPAAVLATSCRGSTRVQLRWSARTHTSIVSFSATQCDRPPACTPTRTLPTGVLVTAAPVVVHITDANGQTLSVVVDPADPACGKRCRQLNRGGCPRGVDTYRIGGSFLRYTFGAQGQTSVVGSKLRVPGAQPPTFTAPVTVTVRDANGYSIEAAAKRCRVRQSASGTAVTCS
ncbi:MAG: hypothetical protein ACE5I7_11305 [Candidatus Binatia bacterium]